MAGIITIVGTIVALTGCQTPGPYMGDEGVKLNVDNAEMVASDLVPLLRVPFNPASTTFLIPSEIASKPIGKCLDTELRREGYAISNDQKRPDAIRLGYEVDRFEGGSIRVSLVAGDRFQVSRLYDEEDDGTLDPEALVTAWREGPPPRRIRRHKVLAQVLAADEGHPQAIATVARADATAHQTSTPPPPSAVVPAATPSAPPAPAANTTPNATTPVTSTAESPATASAAPAVPPAAVAVAQAKPSTPADKPNAKDDDDDPRPDEREIVDVAVNSDNVAEISPALYSAIDSAVPNIFVEQYKPKSLAREVTVRVSTIAMGPRPTAIINDREVGVGDKVEGFHVDAITASAVQLRKGFIRVTVKMQEDPVKIRMP